MSDLLRWGAATDVGRVREANEDALLAESMVFAVADGMGGHQAGEVASAMAADVLRERLVTGTPSVDVLVAAVVEANAAIFQTARRNSAQMGMGTTLTALAVVPSLDGEPAHLALANVGDSRTYLLRNGALHRTTIDHSYVQELLATGHITEDEARHHPRRNIVTRALGIEPSVRVDSWRLPLVQGDRFVLCSDGLVDEIDDESIRAIAVAHPHPQTVAEQLVAAAVANGGRDNVTVVVVDVLGGEPAPPADDPAPTGATTSGGDTPAVGNDTAPTATAAPAPLSLTLPPVADTRATGLGGVAADPLGPPPAATAARKWQLTGRTLLFLLAVAVVLTVIVTLVAVAITGTDTPTPTTTTTVAPTTVAPTAP